MLRCADRRRQEAYAQSKLCNILFAREFDKKFKRTGIRALAVNPGGSFSTVRLPQLTIDR